MPRWLTVALAIAVTTAFAFGLTWAVSLIGANQSIAGGIDVATGTVTLVLRDEPPQLDSTLTVDGVSGMVLGHVMEGLLRYDAHGRIAPGVAERWQIDGTTATFWLRRNARWSDGGPVTAHDFVFAWRRVVDPASGAQYASILYPIENAEQINLGRLPASALGATALDDFTLLVRLAQPTAYFDNLAAFFTYYPIREDFHRATGGRYGAEADTLLYNGPFQLTRWVHGAHLRLEKNPHYWDRDRIQIERLDFPYLTPDPTTHLNLFKDGRTAYTTLVEDNLTEAMARGWQLHRFLDGSLVLLRMNFRDGRATRSWHLRKALQLTLDPAELVYRVMKLPGALPGESIFPIWLRGVRAPLRQEHPAPRLTIDAAEARRHLELALDELGAGRIGPLVLLIADNPLASKQAEYYQETLKRTLGLDIVIDKQIFKQRLAKMRAGDFDLAITDWAPDFDDPLTFADLFASWNANNRTGYANPQLDAHVRTAQQSTDPVARAEAFAAVQQILFDDITILPVFERAQVYVVDPRLEGVARQRFGPDPDFTNARIIDR
jgi:oligopeptide transport system substrate-binding protein